MKRQRYLLTPDKYLIIASILLALISSTAARVPTDFNFFNGNSTTNAPALLSGLGLYSNMAEKTVAAGVYPYDVNVSRWNSGAFTERFIAVPNDSTVTYYGPTRFIYPVGTTLIQNYGFEMTLGDSSTKKLVETRLLVYVGGLSIYGFFGFTYAWDADQSEARLVNSWSGKDTAFTINLGGGNDTIPWRYYSQIQCGECHSRLINTETGMPSDSLDGFMILSFVPPQLNLVSSKTGGQNQLQYFADDGLITGAMPPPEQQHSWAKITDGTQPIKHRIQSYYAVNCGNCHSDDGFAAGSGAYGYHRMDYFLATDTMNYINKLVSGPYFPDDTVGYDDQGLVIKQRHYGYAIHGGYPDSSVLWLLQNNMTMPNKGISKKDSVALDTIKNWILSIPTPPLGVKTFSSEKTPDRGIIRNNILYLKEDVSSVGLFDLKGRAVPLKFILSGMYYINQDLTPGVYLLKSGKNTNYVYNSP